MEMSLTEMMQAFVLGNDTSIELVNTIELEIDDGFPDDDYMQQTLVTVTVHYSYGDSALNYYPVTVTAH